MKRSTWCCCALAGVLMLATSQAHAGKKLSEILKKTKWDRILGTWVDAKTKGKALKMTYAWKIKDRVIESVSQDDKKKSVALMGVNAKNGDVYHFGADGLGATTIGKWDLKDGEGTLGVGVNDGNGKDGALQMHFKFVNDDTILVNVIFPIKFKLKLIRVK